MEETNSTLVEKPELSLEEKVQKTIQNNTYAAVGVGLIPLPLLDFVALTGVQVNMINNICKHYGVPFSEDAAKNIISALVGAGITNPVGVFAASLIKIVPVIGQTVSVLAMPAVAGATTYAVGKVIDMHLMSGGSLLNFNSAKMREHFNAFKKEGEVFAKRAYSTASN